jgi:hypothetical protein
MVDCAALAHVPIGEDDEITSLLLRRKWLKLSNSKMDTL